MGDLFKSIFSNLNAVLLFAIVLLLVIAILGFIPLGADEKSRIYLSTAQRAAFVGVAVLVALSAVGKAFLDRRPTVSAPTTEEYEQKFGVSQVKDTIVKDKVEKLTPAEKIIAEHKVKHRRLVIYNDNILESKATVLVSSDDNYFQAKGGVANAVTTKAGPDVLRELNFYRKFRPRLGHGDIAVTTGGLTGARVIIHPAVIDLEENLYPDTALVRKVVRRSLACAVAFGAKSIAFPVLGGGTGSSEYLQPWESIKAIVTESLDFLAADSADFGDQLSTIALYVFNRDDIKEDPDSLFKERA